jgi:HK97 family phage portal protein
MSNPTEQSRALTVLRETVPKKLDSAQQVTSTGARLVSALRSFGLSGTRRMTTEEILQLSAVVVCLDVRSQDIAKVDCRMYERLPGGGKRIVEADEHPIAELLATQPNPFTTWNEFWTQLLLHYGVIQNGYVAKRVEGSVAKELHVCMPVRTTILAVEGDETKRGFYAYKVDRFSPHERIPLEGMPEIFLPGEFIHIRGRMFDGLQGYSNLDAGAKTFNQANELLDYATRLYANDGGMRGVFQHPGEIGDAVSDKAFENLRMQLAELLTNMRRHNIPIVLEEGMTFKEIAMSADQAELTKQREAAIVDVARTFRIPPHKMMHLINVKYENMETLEKSYVSDSLIPTCIPIEQKMKMCLLSRAEQMRYFFEFDRRQMLLNDIEKLTEATDKMVKSGSMEFDEQRTALGFNPMANNQGKKRIIPSTYNLIDSATGKVEIAAGAQPAGDDKKPADGAKPKPKPKDVEEDNILEFPSLVGER